MILGVSGSPRRAATEYVLQWALGRLEEVGYQTRYWTVAGKDVKHCIHCDRCLDGSGCSHSDGLTTLYPLLEEAQAYVVATPVYNGTLSSQLKAVLDRCRALLAKEPRVFQGKPFACIAVGGDRCGGQEAAIQAIHAFAVMNGGIPVAGGPFGANLGATFWSRDSLEGVKADEEGFKSLSKTLKQLVFYLGRGRP